MEVVGSNLSSCYYYSLIIGCVRDKGIVPIRIYSDMVDVFAHTAVLLYLSGLNIPV